MTTQQLVRAARDGDQRAISSLYRRYGGQVHATVRRYTRDDSTADDWAQEAWIRAVRGLGTFRQQAAFATWLYRVAVNTALDGRRKLARRAEREVEQAEEVEDRGPAADPLLRLVLRRAVDDLPHGMRQVLVLHDVQGFTHEEIAGRLGIAPGTSRSQLYKARAKLRTMLGEPAAA